MIAFAFGLLVVTFRLFEIDVIIVFLTNLFELTFEFTFTTFDKDNKLRLQATCQVLWNNSWMDIAD
jgi:hypothetical protein